MFRCSPDRRPSRQLRLAPPTFACLTIALLSLTHSTCFAADKREPLEVGRVRALVEAEKKTILFFAHPTSSYRGLRFEHLQTRTDGIGLVYTFLWHANFSNQDHETELTFHCRRGGKLELIEVGPSSSMFPPFYASDTIVRLLKQQIRSDPELKNDDELAKLLDKNSKEILETYLRRDVAALGVLVRSLVGLAADYAADTSSISFNKPTAGDDRSGDAALAAQIRKSTKLTEAERSDRLATLPKMTAAQRDRLRIELAADRPRTATPTAKNEPPPAPLEEARLALAGDDQLRAVKLLTTLITAADDDAGEVYLEALTLRAAAYQGLEKWQFAVDDYSRLIDLQPKADAFYRRRAGSYAKLGDHRRALVDVMRSAELAPQNPLACNAVAWLLATCPNDKIRDGKEALQFAARACELTKWKDPTYLDTLAAAHAEAGEFDQATRRQREALADPKFAATVGKEEKTLARNRLKLYESGKPFHEQ